MARKDAATASRVSAATRTLRTGLLGTMFVMSRNSTSRPWRTVLDLLIRSLQMISFVVSSVSRQPCHACTHARV